jgi:hypothetical protein
MRGFAPDYASVVAVEKAYQPQIKVSGTLEHSRWLIDLL